MIQRDPERIPRILENIRMEWEARPDFRLGQLLHALCRERRELAGDLFFTEDSMWEKETRETP